MIKITAREIRAYVYVGLVFGCTMMATQTTGWVSGIWVTLAGLAISPLSYAYSQKDRS